MFGNVNWYFLLTLQQQIVMTDLKPCFACENTSVLIILATTVYTVGTESIQTPLNFSLFVILQPFAKII